MAESLSNIINVYQRSRRLCGLRLMSQFALGQLFRVTSQETDKRACDTTVVGGKTFIIHPAVRIADRQGSESAINPAFRRDATLGFIDAYPEAKVIRVLTATVLAACIGKYL
jgi:hypothetical protein